MIVACIHLHFHFHFHLITFGSYVAYRDIMADQQDLLDNTQDFLDEIQDYKNRTDTIPIDQNTLDNWLTTIKRDYPGLRISQKTGALTQGSYKKGTFIYIREDETNFYLESVGTAQQTDGAVVRLVSKLKDKVATWTKDDRYWGGREPLIDQVRTALADESTCEERYEVLNQLCSRYAMPRLYEETLATLVHEKDDILWTSEPSTKRGELVRDVVITDLEGAQSIRGQRKSLLAFVLEAIRM